MRICIVGGALQGMECVLLARAAGYRTVVVDRRPDAPALSLCDEPAVMDPVADPTGFSEVANGCDFVIPACEDVRMLDFLAGSVDADSLLFDRDAYAVTSSKLESNRLMSSLGVPMPLPWPECGFPAIVKPSSQSGSVGVTVAHDEDDISRGIELIRALEDDAVIQGFASGRSVSVEVVGDGSRSEAFVTTEVCLDPDYDCKMVRCRPGILSREDEARFDSIGTSVAGELGLRGIMDVEAIATDDGLRVLEVDARMPSQTPAAVLFATGVNLLGELVRSAEGHLRGPRPFTGSSVYRHVVFSDGRLGSCGEKEFAKVRSPRFVRGLFGSDLAITDYEPDADEWRATLIVSGNSPDEADSRSEAVTGRMLDELLLESFTDGSPEVV